MSDPSTPLHDEPSAAADLDRAPHSDVTQPDPTATLERRSFLGLTLAVALGVWVVDQLVKWWAVTHLEGQPSVEVIGSFLKLTFVRNPGAAFGLGGGYTILFSLLAAGVAFFIVRSARKLGDPLWAIALGALMGGAVGNLTDRIFRSPGFLQGHVVDMFELPNWPVFNVADMAIVTSAALLVLLTVLGREADGTRRRG